MAGFKCPFCGIAVSESNTNKAKHIVTFSGHLSTLQTPHLKIYIYKCPDCRKETVIAQGQNGYIEEKTILIYPESDAIQFPEYVPVNIRTDYEEACAIKTKSPKACATLARRCLQGMIRDFWGIQKSRLVDEIQELKDKIPASQWAAIDALRKLGNIGAHMEKDVNLIVEVEPEEAEKLLRLIELLIDKWYIARNDEESLFKDIAAAAASKKS